MRQINTLKKMIEQSASSKNAFLISSIVLFFILVVITINFSSMRGELRAMNELEAIYLHIVCEDVDQFKHVLLDSDLRVFDLIEGRPSFWKNSPKLS